MARNLLNEDRHEKNNDHSIARPRRAAVARE
jgi:hypothetical protein